MNASKHQCRDSSTNAGQQGKPLQKNRSVKVTDTNTRLTIVTCTRTAHALATRETCRNDAELMQDRWQDVAILSI